MENFERKTSPKNGIDTENWFIESYRRYKGHPIRILIALYKGNYHKFVMAGCYKACMCVGTSNHNCKYHQ